MFYISPLFAGPTDSMGMHYLFNLTNPNLSTKTKYYEFTPQNLSVAFCYITTAQRCFYPFALFSYSKSKGGAAHVERSITFSFFHAWHNRRRNFDVSAAGRKAGRRAVFKIL